MASSDALQTATDEAKNTLEEYLLALRSHLSDRYADFVRQDVKDQLSSDLTALEDWLYEDGEDEKKSVCLLSVCITCASASLLTCLSCSTSNCAISVDIQPDSSELY